MARRNIPQVIFLFFSVISTVLSLDPLVNSPDLQIIDNATNTIVTTITDVEYVFLRYNVSGFGVTINDLRVCDNADCSNHNVQIIDSGGCPVEFSGFGKLVPTGFVRDPTLSHVYETQPFRLFRWDNGNSLYLTAQRSICETSSAVCSDQCTASGRRRRREAALPGDISGTYVVSGSGGRPCTIIFGKAEHENDSDEKGDEERRISNLDLPEKRAYLYLSPDIAATYTTSLPNQRHDKDLYGKLSVAIKVILPLSTLTSITAVILTIIHWYKRSS